MDRAGGHVDTRRGDGLRAGVLEPELLDDQLGVAKVGLELEPVIRPADDAVQDLALAELVLAVAALPVPDPLRLDLVSLGQRVLQPIQVARGPCAAVVIAVHERPHVAGLVVEH